MISNNSNKNDAIEERDRVINMLELSTRDRNLHDPSSLDCICDSCIQAESDRLDWFISMKKPAEGQIRGIRTMVIGEDESETGLVWGWELVPEEGEPALFTSGQWVSLMPLMEGKKND